jgi:hypothetical protein
MDGKSGERIMTRKEKRTTEQKLFEAEERAIACLAKLAPDVAAATAVMVAFRLGKLWLEEYRQFFQYGQKPEQVFEISEDDFERLRTARSLLPPDAEVDWSAFVDVSRIFRDLGSDSQWWAAYTVACRACGAFLLGQRQKLDEMEPELVVPGPDTKSRPIGPRGWLV